MLPSTKSQGLWLAQDAHAELMACPQGGASHSALPAVPAGVGIALFPYLPGSTSAGIGSAGTTWWTGS